MEERFSEAHCCECGIRFAIEREVRDIWTKKGHLFYCPNGHRVQYKKQVIADKTDVLEKEIAQLKSDNDMLTKRCECQRKQIQELKTKLEVWEPRSNNGND